MGLKLDQLDKKIVYYLDRNARQTASALSRKLSVPKETVNFRMKRLLKNSIIKGFYPILDLSKIDRFFFKIFVKFRNIHPDRQKEILDFFAHYQHMSQVLLLEGIYDVQLYFLAQEHADLLHFIQSMNKFCGSEIQRKEILIVDTMYRFNLTLFYDKEPSETSKVRKKTEKFALDKVSWQVLKEISKDARISVLDIAKNVGISSQLALYHIKKLIKDKVIVSTHIAINYNLLHKQHYHVTFQVNDHGILPNIISFFQSKKKSIFATTMIGCYDASAEVMVDSSEELRSLIDELMVHFSEKINTLDIFLIYKEYELRLYPI